MTAKLTDVDVLKAVALAIYENYRRVASGETLGAGGHFAANGRGTLTAVVVNVELMEDLAHALRKPVLGRDHDDRYPPETK